MQVKPENLKIVTISFLILSFLAAFVVRVLFELLSVSSGFFANFYSQDVFRHGLPIASGVICFFVLQFKASYQKLADEVVSEVRKVVWVSKKDLYSMTLLVTVILIISGLTLGFFDFFSGMLVKFFIG